MLSKHKPQSSAGGSAVAVGEGVREVELSEAVRHVFDHLMAIIEVGLGEAVEGHQPGGPAP